MSTWASQNDDLVWILRNVKTQGTLEEEIWNFFFSFFCLFLLFLKKDFLSKLRIVFRISYTRKFPKSSQTDTFQSGSWIIRLSVCFFTPLIVVYSLKLRVWLWKYSPWLLLERNKKDPQKAFYESVL